MNYICQRYSLKTDVYSDLTRLQYANIPSMVAWTDLTVCELKQPIFTDLRSSFDFLVYLQHMIINISLLTNILQTRSKVANDKKACLS